MIATSADNIEKLKVLLPKLPRKARIAIQLRFWENMTIEEISNFLRLSWDQADQLIENSIKALREKMEEPSRNQNIQIAS